MSDVNWMLLRYALIAGGAFMSARGWVPAELVGPTVEAILNAAPGMLAAGSAIWGVVVAWKTKRVPIEVAKRADVPTVNPATGSIEAPSVVH